MMFQYLYFAINRNLAKHLHTKVYETQEDLCHKRNEIRLASLQLAMVRSRVCRATSFVFAPENPRSNRKVWVKCKKDFDATHPKNCTPPQETAESGRAKPQGLGGKWH